MASAPAAEGSVKPPPARPKGRSLADFGRLRPAEKKLLHCCRSGEVAEIAEEVPDSETRQNRVRASFLRFLALGGDENAPVHERGVQLRGAWLIGLLDLEAVQADRRLVLQDCRIERIEARLARLKFLVLAGCRLIDGMSADGLACEGVFLRHGFHATGPVRLLGASIGGKLDCSAGRFENPDDVALVCDGMVVSGDVFLGHGFSAQGEVALPGVQITGILVCDEGTFDCEKGIALSLEGARVGGALFARNVTVKSGRFMLTGARVGSLCDNAASWKDASGRLVLDGLTYGHFIDAGDAASRIAWLDCQWESHLGDNFRPQPWEEVIRVLRSMGHPEEARAVAVEKQERIRKAGRLPRGARPFHWLYGQLVGYGYRPLRLVTVTVWVWIIWAAFYWAATNPARGRPHLLAPAPLGEVTPPADYANFVPLIYSADVLLPVVDLGYKDDWLPVVRGGRKPLLPGQILRFLYWFEIAFGWIAGLLLVGVLGNLIKKD